MLAKVTYINGMEAGSEVLSNTILQEPVKEILVKGTLKISTSQTSNGSTLKSKYPLPLRGNFRLTSKFGPRNTGISGASSYHRGIDLAAPSGTPIYASMAGTVIKSGSASGYGLVIYINHANGVQTRYGHCSKLLVKNGAKVKQGDLIALVGSTGVSSGPHVHFEVRVNGTAVNPLK